MKVFWGKQSLKDIPVSNNWLHPSEQQVLDGFRFLKKRNDWLLGRWTAKIAVKSYVRDLFPNLSYGEIEIRAAEDGAPEVFKDDKPLQVLISLSHSNGMSFCCITSPKMRLGCDLEKIEPRSHAFVNDYFTIAERHKIAWIAEADRPLYANLIWSAKESALKALRTGLRIDTRKVEVIYSSEADQLQWNKLQVFSKSDNKLFHGFWQDNLGFVFTLVFDYPDVELEEIIEDHGIFEFENKID